ncbi:MAG: cell wall-binding repeat-containing protein [Peptostreptococcus sp.]|uniref:cell wall-binding repeat-containing protein n=1 Tax=Peptostreptococcus sp. TaxID=1262 RepID=UPI002FC5FA88
MKKRFVIPLLLVTCMLFVSVDSKTYALVERNVSSYGELVTAVNDKTISKVIVDKNIDLEDTITINGDKEIVGKDSKVTLKATKEKPMISLSSNTNKVNLSNLKFDGNNMASQGVYLAEKKKSVEMKIDGCDFEKLAGSAINLSKYEGSRDAVGYAKLDLTNSNFLSNTDKNDSKLNPGLVAVRADEPIINVDNCKFEDNIFEYGVSGVNIASNPTAEFKDKNEGNLVVKNSEFKNNSNKNANGGGAINASRANVTLSDTNFIGNTSQGYAGAVRASASNGDKSLKITINGENNDFIDNKVKNNEYENSDGGALQIEGMDSDISNANFTKNSSETEGGALYYTSENSAKKTFHILNNVKFVENKSEETGGAIHTRGINDIKISNTTFDKNKTKGSGGALYYFSAIDPDKESKNSDTNINFEKVTFKDNTAAYGAGVFYSNEDRLSSKIYNSELNNNIAEVGGALYMNTYTFPGVEPTNSNFDIQTTNFVGNQSEFGGAIYAGLSNKAEQADPKQNIDITKSMFEKNKSDFGGAIAYDKGTTSNVSATKFNDNIATGDGGAFYLRMDKDLIIKDSEFNRNTAEDGRGGAINVLTTKKDKITEDTEIDFYKHVKADNVKFNDNKASTGIFEASKEKYPEINKLYKENFLNIKSLSKPAKISKNIAYNNYDVSFISDKVIVPTPDPGGGGSGGGSGSSKTTAILANGKKYTDVLTATVLANEKKCPILLTETDSISKETMDELNRRGVGKLIISGGEKSVSKKVVDQLADFDVVRYAGNNRYETAREIAKQVRLESGNKNEAVLVDGTNFPDVITISALASQKRAPILLTEPSKLNNTTENVLKEWNIEDVTIGGQTKSVSTNVENKVKNISNDVVRIGGHDRYKTASLIGEEVRKLTGNKKDMVLVDGTDFPDGITVNSLAAKYKCPIHLTNPNTLTKTTRDDITNWNIENILVAGGTNSVSADIYNNLGVKNKERVAGNNRYTTAVEISKRLDKSNTPIGKLN